MSREIGDIENDLGFVEAQLEDIYGQLSKLKFEKEALLTELANVDTWSDT